MQEDKQILLVAQKNASDDDPTSEDLYKIGTVASVLQLLKLPDGTVKVSVEGKTRAEVQNYLDNDEFFEAEIEEKAVVGLDGTEIEALCRSVVGQFEQYIKLNKKIPPEALVSVNQIEEADKLADTVSSHLALKMNEKQELLEIASVSDRMEKNHRFDGRGDWGASGGKEDTW
jgi:ATP-dependent Lon protease